MTDDTPATWRSKLTPSDLLFTSLLGLRSRPARTLLTAAGIAIGIASMVAVTGISASSRAALLAELDTYGTNVLEVRAAQNGLSVEPLPTEAAVMLDRIPTVVDSAPIIGTSLKVRRNRFDSELIGIDTIAADADLAPTLRATMATGRAFDDGTRSLPVVILGAAAAERLNIVDLTGGPAISIGGRDFAVIGVLDPLPLNPDIDRSAIIGDLAAVDLLGLKPHPTRILLRIDPDRVDDTTPLLAPTANPDSPSKVGVSRPSDLVQARAEIDRNLRNLLLTLGAVALIVGGLGIANIMVVSVLERTGEIGLRRAIGANRGHIALQFMLEAAALAAIGGLAGAAAGSAITGLYARRQGWLVDIPPEALLGGVLAAIVIGIVAGLYPANKAARLDPAEAVRSGTR